jgi:hypothetical protein
VYVFVRVRVCVCVCECVCEYERDRMMQRTAKKERVREGETTQYITRYI